MASNHSLTANFNFHSPAFGRRCAKPSIRRPIFQAILAGFSAII